MIGKILKIIICAGLITLFSFAPQALSADSGTAAKPQKNVTETYVSPMGAQFVRGLTNVITGWGEIPRQIILSGKDDGIALALPLGLAKGLMMTVARTFYGSMETAFFMVPFGEDYSSAMIPAYVWQDRPESKNAPEKQ